MSGNAADVRVCLWRGGMCLDGKDKIASSVDVQNSCNLDTQAPVAPNTPINATLVVHEINLQSKRSSI